MSYMIISHVETDIAPEVDVLAVGDTTLDASAPVGAGAEGAIGTADEGVVVLAAGHLGTTEAGADLESLGGRDREHGVSEFRLELVEHWLSKPRGYTSNHASHGPADRVKGLFGTDNALSHCKFTSGAINELGAYLGHAFCCLRVGAASGMCVDLLASNGLQQVYELRAQRILDDLIFVSSSLRWRRDVRRELDFADR